MRKKIVVGLDFDGVVAYNPARLARFPISFVKRYVCGIQHVSFFVPKTPFERVVWALGHETSMFPAKGVGLLRTLVSDGIIEAHLVTGRFGYLEPHLLRFLKLWKLTNVFRTITLNVHEEQPHEYKSRVVTKKKFDYYIEDNWDIVHHLHKKKITTEVHWIYNLFDRGRAYEYKYPYLGKSLEHMLALNKLIPNRFGVKAKV